MIPLSEMKGAKMVAPALPVIWALPEGPARSVKGPVLLKLSTPAPLMVALLLPPKRVAFPPTVMVTPPLAAPMPS